MISLDSSILWCFIIPVIGEDIGMVVGSVRSCGRCLRSANCVVVDSSDRACQLPDKCVRLVDISANGPTVTVSPVEPHLLLHRTLIGHREMTILGGRKQIGIGF